MQKYRFFCFDAKGTKYSQCMYEIFFPNILFYAKKLGHYNFYSILLLIMGWCNQRSNRQSCITGGGKSKAPSLMLSLESRPNRGSWSQVDHFREGYSHFWQETMVARGMGRLTVFYIQLSISYILMFFLPRVSVHYKPSLTQQGERSVSHASVFL